eukprot:CAMPEP_0171299146 /NCGR_PEP_ID=MMETSP0816-20121228/7936_1 /TAXON_ID=420281 /ORGANISM="Proboscia inermis, Strain CCAP1064/1" /LENGTH=287 /DNA_ID=CAMNT_0011774697 /DNA_START=49 /DNA_END=912 /DNA_ORIENTATION=+
MKLIISAAFFSVSCAAFSPIIPSRTTFGVTSRGKVVVNDNKVPFFADENVDTEEEAKAVAPSPSVVETIEEKEMTLEEEVDMLVEEEMKKSSKMSNLRNANGVDYAPWMGIDEEEETMIRSQVKAKSAARRARQEQEKSVSGNLYLDSQAQEISGTGLTTKVIDGKVELEWATKSENDTKGFVVRRRPAKTEDFTVIASYKDFGPLVSKGSDGGVYRFLDKSTTPGGWVYRITECDQNDIESDLCQCLIDVQTDAEQRGAVIAAVGFAIFAIGATAAGVLLDPMNGN